MKKIATKTVQRRIVIMHSMRTRQKRKRGRTLTKKMTQRVVGAGGLNRKTRKPRTKKQNLRKKQSQTPRSKRRLRRRIRTRTKVQITRKTKRKKKTRIAADRGRVKKTLLRGRRNQRLLT